ncbi:MAG TPA: hypothetical protein VMR73_00325 [Candidatus Paceibacterota bacterium]|nr:hypothetical protein [Candidatus Paceibacterota bacterium]
MSWSSRKKIFYFLIVVALALVFIALPSFFVFYKAPTCFDGKQDQGEQGIDCGGPCTTLCQASFSDPRELWATSSEVVSGVYNALAYVVNPNINAEAQNIAYDFRLYDSNGLLIVRRDGETSIPPVENFGIFEPSITTGNRTLARTFFEFESAPVWQKVATTTQSLVALSSNFQTSASSSRLDMIASNPSPDTEQNIEVIAILYGTDGNVAAFSKTVIPVIAAGDTAEVSFTWPYGISATIAKKEFLFKEIP